MQKQLLLIHKLLATITDLLLNTSLKWFHRDSWLLSCLRQKLQGWAGRRAVNSACSSMCISMRELSSSRHSSAKVGNPPRLSHMTSEMLGPCGEPVRPRCNHLHPAPQGQWQKPLARTPPLLWPMQLSTPHSHCHSWRLPADPSCVRPQTCIRRQSAPAEQHCLNRLPTVIWSNSRQQCLCLPAQTVVTLMAH